MHGAATLAICLGLLGALACSREEIPQGAADPTGHWLGAVGAGIPVYDYTVAPREERSGRIELVPELVISERPGTDDYSFGEAPPTVALDDEANIFVYDAGNYRVKVFDHDGEYLYGFGSRGEGPGEFSSDRRGQVGFSRGLLFIMFSYRRLGFWTREGDFLDGSTHRIDELKLVPLHDGAFLAADYLRGAPRRPTSLVVGRYRLTEDRLREDVRYAIVPAGLRPQFTGRIDGSAYVSSIDGNVTEVVAFTPAATPLWRARFRWPPGQQVMASDLLIDGQDRIYVYPRRNRLVTPPAGADRAIDVLSPEGHHIVSAVVRDFRVEITWQQARDGYVYGVEENPRTFEWQVVRYRLELPAPR